MIVSLLKVLASNVTVLVLKLISGFLFPAAMSTEDYALYQTFALYISYITFAGFGFATGMFVNYGGKRYQDINLSRYKSEGHVLSGILLFSSALMAAASIFIRNEMMICITVCVLPYCICSSYQSLYQAWGQFKKFSRTNVLLNAIPLIGSAIIYFIFHRLSAKYYIFLFILVYVICTFSILYEFRVKTKGVHSCASFSNENFHTLKTGFAIFIGNYVNVLLCSVDKQFVKSIFSTIIFARYSFGLSLQSLLMVFITSTAQPMFNFLASGRIERKKYNLVKQMLLVLGTCSGMALFACRWIVTWLLPTYVESIEIIEIYFVIFPAMAVINCLYINLYKITKKSKQYIKTLVKVLLLSVVLNAVFVFVWRDSRAISAATVITYYIWLFADSRKFENLEFEAKDYLFIAFYFIAYICCQSIGNVCIGIGAYIMCIAINCLIFYKNSLIEIRSLLRKKLLKK